MKKRVRSPATWIMDESPDATAALDKLEKLTFTSNKVYNAPDLRGWVGVDPGRSSGCIAFLRPTPGGGDPYNVQTWLLAEMTDREIWEVLQRLRMHVQHAVLEEVHSMPKQGVSSSFKFGASYGELKMAVIAAGIKLHKVTPQKWQAAMRCLAPKGAKLTKTEKKKISRARAQEVFPWVKIKADMAEAMLLAEYARVHVK